MPQRKPLRDRTTDSGRPARPRAISGAILLLVAVSILIALPVHIISSETDVGAEEDQLRRDGVKLIGEQEFLYTRRQGRRFVDRMFLTYEYQGKSHSTGFDCDNCSHETQEVPVWIDPDDPTVFVSAHASTAGGNSGQFIGPLALLSIPAYVTTSVVIIKWRWWLSLPKSKKRVKRKSAPDGESSTREPLPRRTVVVATLLLVSVLVGVPGVVHMARFDAIVAAEETRLRDHGVAVPATLEHLSRIKIGEEHHDQVLATYVYEGVSRSVEIICDGCLDDEEHLIWVDPADPGNWLAESGSSARDDSTALDIILFISPVVPLLAILFAARFWRQWIPPRQVRKPRRRARPDR